MEGNYEVLFEGQPVGKLELMILGLYCRVHCCYQLSEQCICRLIAKWNDGWENLGIPIPEGSGMELCKKLPAKRIHGKELQFVLIPIDMDVDAYFAPVPQEQPESQDPEPKPMKEEYTQYQPLESEQPQTTVFIPISEDEPFEQLGELENAVFTQKNGEFGAEIQLYTAQKDQSSRESPTGQWSDPMVSE